MNEILFHYEKIAPTTWAYLASLLIIGLFFKFGRFWSVRNLDLLLLILLAPGLLLVSEGQKSLRDAAAALAEETKSAREAIPPKSADDPTQAATTPIPTTDSTTLGSTPLDSTAAEATAADKKTDETETATPTQDRRNKKPQSDAGADASDTNSSPAKEALRKGTTIARIGYIWLLTTGLLLLARCLVDSTMVRRPLLEPNMTTGGLIFSCCSMFVFLMANIVVSRPTADDMVGPASAEQLMSRRATDDIVRHGPGYALVFMLPSLPTVKTSSNLSLDPNESSTTRPRQWKYQPAADQPFVDVDAEFLEIAANGQIELQKLDGTELSIPPAQLSEEDRAFVSKIQAYTTVAKLVAVLSHLAILIGIIAIGYWHFNNVKMGIGAAALYLMLPYTSQMTGYVDHVLPTAMLILGVLTYRRPLLSGVFLGLAIGIIYYPLFLLPLWISFYWQRGLWRFLVGLVFVLAVMVLMLVLVSPDSEAFWQCFKKMFGLMPPQSEGLTGIWRLGWNPVYRYPILAAFVALSGSLAIWPAQKNLGTLISCSAAVMIATQFWHGYGGGLYMAWYLPLFLLTVFRPNLEDRVAASVVGEGWQLGKA
jgi:hypothetical protein